MTNARTASGAVPYKPQGDTNQLSRHWFSLYMHIRKLLPKRVSHFTEMKMSFDSPYITSDPIIVHIGRRKGKQHHTNRDLGPLDIKSVSTFISAYCYASYGIWPSMLACQQTRCEPSHFR